MAPRARPAGIRKNGLQSTYLRGEEDHLHLLVESHRNYRCRDGERLKVTSSRLLRQERPGIAARYRKGVLCPPATSPLRPAERRSRQ
ncbi:MAG: transposase [Chloracidobacterium sp.]|nr:transposase [Chloracidobacterium sp.]